jgi:Spy/CpxP family protein refolding chaperone
MNNNLVARAAAIVAIGIACTVSSFAQAPVEARQRRVAVDKINQQPVAASAIALQQGAALNLTEAQRTKIQAFGTEAVNLHAERARLWNEYNAIISSPTYNDDVAASQGAPRMLRIVAINNRLKEIAASQNGQVAAILTPSQQTALNRLVANVQAQGR